MKQMLSSPPMYRFITKRLVYAAYLRSNTDSTGATDDG